MRSVFLTHLAAATRGSRRRSSLPVRPTSTSRRAFLQETSPFRSADGSVLTVGSIFSRITDAPFATTGWLDLAATVAIASSVAAVLEVPPADFQELAADVVVISNYQADVSAGIVWQELAAAVATASDEESVVAVSQELVASIAVASDVAADVRVASALTLLTPLNGATFGGREVAGDTITLFAEIPAGAPTVTKVDFYSGSSIIGTANAAPWQVQWTTTTGSYGVKAIATFADSTTGASPVANITVAAPTSAPAPTPIPEVKFYSDLDGASALNAGLTQAAAGDQVAEFGVFDGTVVTSKAVQATTTKRCR